MKNKKHPQVPRLAETRVLHDGWETDNAMWLEVRTDGTRICTTDHGAPVEISITELDEKIAETLKSLQGLQIIRRSV